MSDFNIYKIVGFDLRKTPILDLGGPKKLGEHWPTDGPARPPYPPTISEQTWPRPSSCEGVDYSQTNGVNLLWLPDAQILDREAISAAFSLRAADAAVFERDSWVLTVDEGYLNPAFGWRLLGYDVVDSYLGYSGFYGFTWKPGQMAAIFQGLDIVFNRRGLLDDEELAARVGEILTADPGTASHAPFYPVRVWAQILGGDIKRREASEAETRN